MEQEFALRRGGVHLLGQGNAPPRVFRYRRAPLPYSRSRRSRRNSVASAHRRSRSVRLCYKNGPFVSSGQIGTQEGAPECRVTAEFRLSSCFAFSTTALGCSPDYTPEQCIFNGFIRICLTCIPPSATGRTRVLLRPALCGSYCCAYLRFSAPGEQIWRLAEKPGSPPARILVAIGLDPEVYLRDCPRLYRRPSD
jgi:hypothetical protein